MGTSKSGFLSVHVQAIAGVLLGSLSLSKYEVTALTSGKAANLEDWLTGAGCVLDGRPSREARLELQKIFRLPLWLEKGDDIAMINEYTRRRAAWLVYECTSLKRRHIRRALRKLRKMLATIRALKRALEELERQLDIESNEAFANRVAWELDMLARDQRLINDGMKVMKKNIK